ncbi:MAG: tRNA lysidine(34) synthetase TilS [Micavibrio sp.]|nr:tRNA lysidine(34) synthetase TilS [Micavibrio sp.]|tara:strand:- start:6699 stop:7667 length:969 start_codon:yes stop_codon:yes gene_type:complete
MDDLFQALVPQEKQIIVALSGGADSMALTHMLATQSEVAVHAVTVDHGLRTESADEAKKVGELIAKFPRIKHVILQWQGDKPEAAIQEEARFARYDLLKTYALKHKIKLIFVGHHQDDQAETFLMRLSKGSGLDGLAGMAETQDMGGDITLVRPLLNYTHQELVKYCQDNKLEWVEDPTNKNDKYLRPRLRAARKVLEKEGLTSKRLSVTAQRLSRAKTALNEVTDRLFNQATLTKETVKFDYQTWISQPEEIRVRLVLQAFSHLREAIYAPRMESVENLVSAMGQAKTKLRRTLGGCIVEVAPKKGYISLALEPKKPSFKG